MKLNYTSLQHPVEPVEAAGEDGLRRLSPPMGEKVAASPAILVLPLHGHLAPAAWALAQGGVGAKRESEEAPRVGYVQTAGGALPGSLSPRRRRAARARPALPVTSPRRRPTGASTRRSRSPGRSTPPRGSAGTSPSSARGRGSSARTPSSATAGWRLWTAPTRPSRWAWRRLISPRLSSADPRERHIGLSHHTRTVLELLLAPVDVAVPEGEAEALAALEGAAGSHRLRLGARRPRRLRGLGPAGEHDGALAA